MKFRKRPIEVDAMLFTGDFDAVNKWVSQWLPENEEQGQGMWSEPDGAMVVDTAEGEMRAEIGDWIIREPFPVNDREFYPCKPDIFERTYESVSN